MRFTIWEPVYCQILRDFGYSRMADEQARDVLSSLSRPFNRNALVSLEGATVAVCGGGRSLQSELDVARDSEFVIAASTAADICIAAGVNIDLMVTDLDKIPHTARQLTQEEIPVAVHAHGDNLPAIRKYVPTFKRAWMLPTTQAEPIGPVENFGGFTDGDRGAFLADHFGAESICFPGWDFDDPSVGSTKRQKLAWAQRLLYWLEHRRGEQFAVLDGRRDDLDITEFPL